MRLDRVLERAAVDLDRVGHAGPASPRARISGPITRWLASATSGRARSATSRDGGDVALEVGSSSASVSSGNGRASMPS